MCFYTGGNNYMRKKVARFLSLFMIVGLYACGQTETTEQGVTNAITAVKKPDSETINKYFIPLSENVDSISGEKDKATQLVVEQLEFQILDSEMDEKSRSQNEADKY